MNNGPTWKTYAVLILINALAWGGVFVYIATKKELVPHDYRAFYMAGQSTRSSAAEVYDWDRQKSLQQAAYGDTNFVPFYHPPLELVLFAPLSRLSYSHSLNAWRALSLLFLILAGWMIAEATSSPTWLTIAMVAALDPVPICLATGQDALLVLLLVAATFLLLQRNADLAAGCVLSLLVGFKPQLPIVLGIAIFALGRKRFAASFLASSAIVTSVAVAYLGRSGVRNFLHCLEQGEKQIIYNHVTFMPTIRGLICRFFGDHHALTVAVLVLCLAVFFPIWRRSQSLEFVFSTAICLFSFAALHLLPYDLAILAIPLALVLKSPQAADIRLLALISSAPLYILLGLGDLASLLVLPSLLLCRSCFRHAPEAARGNWVLGWAQAFHAAPEVGERNYE